MKKFKFEVYEPGNGAECLSYTSIYESEGVDLNEAKNKLVEKHGCTADYFDDELYVKITEVS